MTAANYSRWCIVVGEDEDEAGLTEEEAETIVRLANDIWAECKDHFEGIYYYYNSYGERLVLVKVAGRLSAGDETTYCAIVSTICSRHGFTRMEKDRIFVRIYGDGTIIYERRCFRIC